MSGLTDFLLARIAEDEAAAACADVRVSYHRRWRQDGEGVRELTPPDAGATFSPARVLAECEAKRRIVAMHGPYEMGGEDYCASCGDVPQVDYPCRTLHALASAYVDRPDYREEWKP